MRRRRTRTDFITVRLTKQELQTLEAAAQRQRQTLSEFLRQTACSFAEDVLREAL